MAWLGMTPSQHSSGGAPAGRHHQTGHGYARKLLIEAAWSYRYPAKVSRIIQVRHENPPSPSSIAPGTHNCACVVAIAASPCTANIPTSDEQPGRGMALPNSW